ncbi:hypothetical protein AWB74_00771 [Caballeronia arvi]|uniref:Uncharacterized protein n=1 Tax=Caballeronia arvi TaxID=1777135 RepID=A0A158FP05_9BURK|nr:hypothetical protein AWB74_00771 [Caballeronia arvi]
MALGSSCSRRIVSKRARCDAIDQKNGLADCEAQVQPYPLKAFVTREWGKLGTEAGERYVACSAVNMRNVLMCALDGGMQKRLAGR